jgi:ketosteroid isomerase-like protein
MDRRALVREAAACFRAGDDDGFVAAFDPAVIVYTEPEVTGTTFINGREELTAWAQRARTRWQDVELDVRGIDEHGDGVVADLLFVPADGSDAGGWRLCLAIGFSGGLIGEVRPFWQREAALGALMQFR